MERKPVRFAKLGLAALVGGLLGLPGCKTTTVIDEYRQAPTSIGASESIVVLGRRHEMDKDTEEDFIACVGSSLASGGAGLNIIPERQFLDAMYPWFETSTAPMDVKNLDRLMRNEVVARRVRDFGLRFFIWVDGFTERTDSSGSVSCAVGPGGGGCFGFATWEDEANYEASIWDVKGSQLSGKISAEGQGTSYMPAVFVPIPLLARVQASACHSMADQLRSFITVESTSLAGDGG